MADKIFQGCVTFLVWLAAAIGTTYTKINVVIFCIIWPLFTVGLVALCLWQRFQIKRRRRSALPKRECMRR